MQRTALVTGSAGFIGYFTAQALLKAGWRVVGFDAITDYYDVALKECRHAMLLQYSDFTAVKARLEDTGALLELFEAYKFDAVIHLAAQAGVRFSIDEPRSYMAANMAGTLELLEAARAFPPAHMLLASTSSVYGANTDMPYRETDQTNRQMSFYAATKKATEGMAHSYAHLYDLPITMFRFFTVYGPWGRPDMAHFKFTRAILNGEAIDIYNHGKMQRDFTYIDDLVTAVCALIDAIPPRLAQGETPAPGDSLSTVAPYRIVNIGNGQPVELMTFIAAIERATGQKAEKNFMPMQPGDVPATWADATLLETLTGKRPVTSVDAGIQAFVDWYRDYYDI